MPDSRGAFLLIHLQDEVSELRPPTLCKPDAGPAARRRDQQNLTLWELSSNPVHPANRLLSKGQDFRNANVLNHYVEFSLRYYYVKTALRAIGELCLDLSLHS